MIRDSNSCHVCRKPFRVGQPLDIIPLGHPGEEEPSHVYAHVKCAAPYRQRERERAEEIKRLAAEISHLDYLASAARGKAHNSINNKALRRQRRLKRQWLEETRGSGWTDKQWEELKRKYDYRCVCCRKKGVKLEPDHIYPLEKGGEHHIRNIQPLCKPCNMRKGARYADHRPRDVRQWIRDIRGQCRYASLTPAQRCKSLTIEGEMFCAVHRREIDRDVRLIERDRRRLGLKKNQ